jgi:hypothetical protein
VILLQSVSKRALKALGWRLPILTYYTLATATPDQLAPSRAVLYRKIERFKWLPLDISAVCSGAVFCHRDSSYSLSSLVQATKCNGSGSWYVLYCKRIGIDVIQSSAMVLSHEIISYTEEDKGRFWIAYGWFDAEKKLGIYLPVDLPYLHLLKPWRKHISRWIRDKLPLTWFLTDQLTEEKQSASIDEIDHMIPHQPSVAFYKALQRP